MVLAAFSLNGSGLIIRITEMMKGQSYLKHLQDHLASCAKSMIGRNYHLNSTWEEWSNESGF